MKQGLVAYIPSLRDTPLLPGGEKEGVGAIGQSDLNEGSGEKMEKLQAGGSGTSGKGGGNEVVTASSRDLYKEKDREKYKANQAAVTPAYPPFASALVPYARWVSIEAIVRTLNAIMGGNINEGDTNQQQQQHQQQQSRREREQQGLALTEEEVCV